MMFMWAFWLVVIVALVWLIRSGGWFRDRGAGSRIDERAVEILKERYARGEIDADMYRRMRDDLMRPEGGPK